MSKSKNETETENVGHVGFYLFGDLRKLARDFGSWLCFRGKQSRGDKKYLVILFFNSLICVSFGYYECEVIISSYAIWGDLMVAQDKDNNFEIKKCEIILFYT